MHRHSDREMRITVNCKLKTVIQVINYKNTEIQILSIWMHCKPSFKVHFVNKSINKFPFQICISFYKVMNSLPDCSYSTLIEVTWPNVNKIEPDVLFRMWNFTGIYPFNHLNEIIDLFGIFFGYFYEMIKNHPMPVVISEGCIQKDQCVHSWS